MTSSLNERKRQILFAVINDYITSALPVGSKTIFENYKLELSPATIRSVMADLEEMGLLFHPHTSAGRVPTPEGFKYYAESFLQIKGVTSADKKVIEQRFRKQKEHIENIMKETSNILSSISSYAGIVLAPDKPKSIFKHLHFIKLREKRLLAVLVTKSGMIQNKIIETDEDISQDELDKIHNYLNSVMHGLSLRKVKENILKEMQKDKNSYDRLVAKAISLGHQAVESMDAEEPLIFLDGEANLLDQPEFSDTTKIKSVLKALQRKTLLVELLEKTASAEGIQIFIGTEAGHPEMKDLSIISSRYVSDDGVLGILGIIGPTRMNYPKVIPLVDFTAKFISKLLTDE